MIVGGPFSQADGPQTVSIGPETHLPWHEIALTITDDVGAPVPSPAAGVISGSARGVGADQQEAFTEDVTLVTGDRRWDPFFSFISDFVFTPAALPANLRYTVTIVNSKG